MIMIIMMPMIIMTMKGYMTIMVFMTADLNRGRGQFYENAENRVGILEILKIDVDIFEILKMEGSIMKMLKILVGI